MSVTVRISSKDLKKAMRDVERWSDAKKKRVRGVVARYALAVEAGAKERAPVDTGRLRSSIRPRYYKNRLDADVFTDVHYAVHQEFGTRYMAGQPFMHPAAEEQRRPFRRAMREALQVDERV